MNENWLIEDFAVAVKQLEAAILLPASLSPTPAPRFALPEGEGLYSLLPRGEGLGMRVRSYPSLFNCRI